MKPHQNSDQIIADHKRGDKVADIAARYRTDKAKVSRIALEGGCKRRRKPFKTRGGHATDGKQRKESKDPERGLTNAVQRGWDRFWSQPHRKLETMGFNQY